MTDNDKILQNQNVQLEVEGLSEEQQRDVQKGLRETSDRAAEVGKKFAEMGLERVPEISRSLAGLAYLGEKLDTPISQLKALDYAFEQIGAKPGVALANLESFYQKVREAPQILDKFSSELGEWGFENKGSIKDKYESALKALAKEQATGPNGEMVARAFASHFGLDEDLIEKLSHAQVQYDKFHAESVARTKGIDEMGPGAIALTQSLNHLWAALNDVATKLFGEHFEAVSVILDDWAKWIRANSDSLRHDFEDVAGQFLKAGEDIAGLFGPFLSNAKKGFTLVGDAVSSVLGGDDKTGMRGIRYLLDAMAVLFGASILMKMLSFLNSLSLGAPASILSFLFEGLGLGGAALLSGTWAALSALYLTAKPQAAGEGENEAYRQAHPGWTPDKPKDPDWKPPKTEADANAAPPAEAPLNYEQIKGLANQAKLGGPWGEAGQNLTTITLDSGKTVQVNKHAAEAYRGFLNDLEKSGYNIHSVGGYNYRMKVGGSSLSQHAYGNAVDVNPDANPFQGAGANFRTDMPSDISARAARYGLSWGGDWRGSKDPMHFEYTGVIPKFAAPKDTPTAAPSEPNTQAVPNTGMPPLQERTFTRFSGKPSASFTPPAPPASKSILANPSSQVDPEGFHRALRSMQHDTINIPPPSRVNNIGTHTYKNTVNVYADNAHEAAIAVGARMEEIHKKSVNLLHADDGHGGYAYMLQDTGGQSADLRGRLGRVQNKKKPGFINRDRIVPEAGQSQAAAAQERHEGWWNYLRKDMGLHDQDARAIMGSLGVESASFRAFHEFGQEAKKGGIGDVQWTAARRKQFLGFVQDHPGMDPASADASHQFFRHEVETNPGYKADLARLQKTRGLGQKVKTWAGGKGSGVPHGHGYERPGKPNWAERIKAAKAPMPAMKEGLAGVPTEDRREI